MSQVEILYDWLSGDESPEADRTLAAALEHAEPPYAARIATILRERASETAWAGLVANYDRLTPQTRRQLHARPDLLRAGIAAALKDRATRGRENALALLADHPCLRLSYLVVDALRDTFVCVREAASQVLRCSAEQVLAEAAPAGRHASAASPEAAAERAALVEALRDALRTFELHLRSDVLEICLWFAKDLGEDFWGGLSARRSHSATVVEQHLASWNHPRLAGFLLLALGQPAWRRAAQALLDSWSTRSELLAILQNSDLLADPLVSHNLRFLERPRWLATANAALPDLPRYAREQLPHWVCHLGLSNEERICCLKVWQASQLPEVHRAAVHALAALGTPEATRVLADVAARPGPMSDFAKQFVASKEAPSDAGRRSPRQESSQAQTVNPSRAGPEVTT